MHGLSGNEKQKGNAADSQDSGRRDHCRYLRQKKRARSLRLRCMDCFEKAVKSKGLERALKVRVPEETYESLKKEIESIEER